MSKHPINFKELIEGGTMFEIEPRLDEGINDSEETEEYERELYKFANLNCAGYNDFEDEDVYNSSEPFDAIASKMENLMENGGIKKRILREGYGNKPGDKSLVKVHYNAYMEYIEEPFDSTYARKKPHTFTVNTGDVLRGLDIAVQSMKINEKSQFMVKPEYAYGKHGCLDRIPPDSTVLFEIELIEVIELGMAEDFKNLPEDKKKEFCEIYKFCMAQCAKAKELFNRNIRGAVREYNIAVTQLEYAQLHVYDDQVKQQELLLKLYSNLLVCYTKLGEPKKGCLNFNKINDMSRGTDLKIPAKVYFNNAKCLRMLGDFNMAKMRLQKAFDMEPRNQDILNEFKIIDTEKKKYIQNQTLMSKALIGGN